MPSPTSLQWLSLIAIIWLQSINGTNSDFPAYSSELKSLLSISQVQLNSLAFASDAGKLLGWLSGIAAAHLPLWLVLLIGAVLGLIGYGVQYLFVVHTITSLPYWQIFLLCVLAGNSICWINTVSYVATIQNFPSDSQIAVGLSTSYFGLSAKIYTSMVDLIFRGRSIKKAEGYLLFNAVVPVVASVVTGPLVREIKNEKGITMRGGFVAMFFITIATGVYAVISTVGPLSRRLSSVAHAVGLGVLLVVPVVIPAMAMIRDGLERRWASKRERRVYSFSMDEISGDVLEIDVKGGDGVGEDGVMGGDGVGEDGVMGGDGVGEDGVMGVGEEIGVKKMVRRVEFWLYFFVYMFGATLGLVFLNNLGQIAESRGLSTTTSLVSLSSSFGFFGRLIPSLLDYFFSKNRYMVSRTASIATYMAPMAGAFFLLLNTTNLSLYISTAIIGVCTGAITSVAVSTTSELFGAKNFSVNHNIIVANIPIGSLLFGYSAALLYQKEGNAGNGKCMGFECYKTTFLVWGFISSLGTLLSFILYIRTRKFYLQRS